MLKIWPIIAILLIEILLFAANYIPGTYLLGWDNIMPEFNIPLNFKRALFAVWQDYRGLGVPDGLSHAANLLHTVYISLLGIVLPQNLLRYTFILVIHLAGGIGMYFLLKKLIKQGVTLRKSQGKREGVVRVEGIPTAHSRMNMSEHWREGEPVTGPRAQETQDPERIVAFLGAFFYMFNLGVIQMFYAPLEVFVVHFAALPIFTLSILSTLKKPTPGNLLALLLVSFAISAQGFVPTLFIVFMILFGSFLVVDFFENHDVKKIIIIAFTVAAANAFWLLPYSYTAIQNAKIIQGTRINQFSSEEIFNRNRATADITSVLSFKGFMLDSIEYDSRNSNNIFFMEKWKEHYGKFYIQLIAFAFILIMLLGLAYVIARKEKRYLAYLISMAASFVFLANNTPLFAQINDIVRSLFPVISEALRFPFTKFIILFAFCFSIFFSLGISILTEVIRKSKLNWKILSPISYSLFTILLFLIAAPAFKGYFFSPLLKLELPAEYKDVFSFFSTQDEKARIAILPSSTFWNWKYRNWGHIGSGFLWYGIGQPLLDRAFDPWSFYNEQFYNEFSYAINKNDKEHFNKVLQKYNIKYLLVDKSIQNSVSRMPVDYSSLESFLNSSGMVQKEREMGNLIIYNVKNQKSNFYVTDQQNTPKVFPGFHFTDQNVLYNASQNFVLDEKNPDSVSILPSLYTGKLQDDIYFEAQDAKDSIILRPKKVFADLDTADNPTLVLPSLFVDEFLIPVEARVSGSQIVFSPLYPTIVINDRVYVIQDQKIVVDFSLLNPSSIEFVDTKNKVEIVNGSAKGFIFNNYNNIIKVARGAQEEIIAVNTENINKASYSIPINSEKINKLEIVISRFDNSLAIQNIIQNKLYEIKYSLDPQNLFPGLARAEARKNASGILLSARANSNVDLSFYLDNLPHPGSYIMFVDSQYRSGLPVGFYAENSFRDRPEVETKLSKTKDKNVIILPPTEAELSGYGFHFTVKSAGQEAAAGVLKNISLFPVPESTIENMKILLNKQAFEVETPVAIVGNKINASLYSLTIEKGNKSKYLVFSQSYDSGWKAYAISTNDERRTNLLQLALPFVFGTELKDHVEVNGWANGWLIESESRSMNQESGIIIVYLPQYLEYVGFGILFFISSLILIGTVKTRRRS